MWCSCPIRQGGARRARVRRSTWRRTGKQEFARTLCHKFLGYALGRSLQLSDQPLLEKMQAELETTRLPPLDAVRAGGRPARSSALSAARTFTPSRFQSEAQGGETMTAGSKISRRLLLKGLGVSVALPWLESLPVWAGGPAPQPRRRRSGSPACSSATASRRRTGGRRARAPRWSSGSSLEPLAPFKEKINVINGLFNREGDGGHARCTGNILSGAALQRGRTIHGGVSMDQRLAKHFEEETAVPSLVLGCEQPVSGFHESQYSMVYASHISWRNPDSPIPIELYPVAGLRQPVRQQGRQAPGEHPRRRAGAGQRPARQGERRPTRRSSTSTCRPCAKPSSGCSGSTSWPEGRRAGVSPAPAPAGGPAEGLPRVRPADVRHHRPGVPDRSHARRDAAAVARPVRPGLPVPGHPRRPPQLLALQHRARSTRRSSSATSSSTPTCSTSWRRCRKASARCWTTRASCSCRSTGTPTTARRCRWSSRAAWAAR